MNFLKHHTMIGSTKNVGPVIYNGPFRIVALGSEGLTFRRSDCTMDKDFEVSRNIADENSWVEWNEDWVTLDKGEYLAIRGNNPNGVCDELITVLENNESFYKIEGNILSLIGTNVTESLPTSCFKYLFYWQDCLKDASGLILPDFTGDECYSQMFADCSNLIEIPNLVVKTFKANCCEAMFSGCLSLTKTPIIKGNSCGNQSFYRTFESCDSLTTVSTLEVATLGENCFHRMFKDCTHLVVVPSLPSTTLAYQCYYEMFEGCTMLLAAPALPATVLVQGCYKSMFKNCISLNEAPALPARTMVNSCYSSMFEGCTALSVAPSLPAITLAPSCYSSMFKNTSLLTIPKLPAYDLEDYCYEMMFMDCTMLSTAEFDTHISWYGKASCSQMFKGCTALTTVSIPEGIEATTCGVQAFYEMFSGCTSLRNVPYLHKDGESGSGCCKLMFYKCKALTSYEIFWSSYETSGDFNNMFFGCSNLNSISLTINDQLMQFNETDWLKDVASTGTFSHNGINITVGANGIPSGWTVVRPEPD